MNDDEKSEKVRFGRAQKFQLSPKGTEAEQAYTAMIEAAKEGSGRAQFDAARAAWGGPLGLSSEDGLFLVEFAQGARTIPAGLCAASRAAAPPRRRSKRPSSAC